MRCTDVPEAVCCVKSPVSTALLRHAADTQVAANTTLLTKTGSQRRPIDVSPASLSFNAYPDCASMFCAK